MAPGLINLLRRRLLGAGLIAPVVAPLAHAKDTAPVPVLKRQALQFPRDLGSHPEFSIEWWYVTGHLRADERE